MGQNPNWPFLFGNDCGECWGPGRPFGVGNTPKKIQLNFSGVVPCPGPPAAEVPDGPYNLEQNPAFPCLWEGGAGVLFFSWWFDIIQNLTECRVSDATGPWIVFRNKVGQCATEMNNGLPVDCWNPAWRGHSGSGVMKWGPAIW